MARKARIENEAARELPWNNRGSMGALMSAMDQEAVQEADKISSGARKEADRKILYAERQVESILKEASENAEERAEQIRQQVLSGVAIEAKRRSLKIREETYQEILQRAVSLIEIRADTREYSQVLLMHIVEAAVGLDVPAAHINATERERSMISAKLIGEAEKRIKTLTSRNTRLAISEEPPLNKQGVVLTSEDGRTAYNNQIDMRLVRKSAEIRQFIHERLFGDLSVPGQP